MNVPMRRLFPCLSLAVLTLSLAARDIPVKNAAELKVRFLQQARPLPYAITLGQALPKGPSMDAIVRKATELGTAAIIPLESERTEVHLDGERSDKKTAKWQTAALEAAKNDLKKGQERIDFLSADKRKVPAAHL